MDVGRIEGGEVGGANFKLDAVRILHQTVVTLRTALEQSKSELNSLREQLNNNPSLTQYASTIESLSIENHVLREKVLSLSSTKEEVRSDSPPLLSEAQTVIVERKAVKDSDIEKYPQKLPPTAKEEVGSSLIPKVKIEETPKITRMSASSNEPDDEDVVNGGSSTNLLNEVFIDDVTTEAEKPLDASDSAITPRISKGDSEESEVDDIELIFTTDDTKELGLQENLVSIAESESWKLDKEEDIPSNLRQTWSQSVLVETDISKCGVIESSSSRRVPPVILRESPTHSVKSEKIIKPSIRFDTRQTVRPILVESQCSKTESGAQTDITALPPHWRSEGYLAHSKFSNMTTLPSKFAFPFPRKHSLRLSEKTQEARRVLLSDINFTSMVPELSRSADHICQDAHSLMARYPRAMCYMKDASPGWCECRTACECCALRARRHSTRPSLYSLDRPASSVPSSPTHSLRSRSVSFSSCFKKGCYDGARTTSAYSVRQTPRPPMRQYSMPPPARHVKFLDFVGQSLPDLRRDSLGGSTDSLIEESEEFLRHSVDSILSLDAPLSHPSHSRSSHSIKRLGDPFLPKGASELRVDYWVKVIAACGRVETGRVRYVGPVPGSTETYVGIVVAPGAGTSDGSYAGATFFSCEPNSAIFVPFKKVILAWCG